MSALLAGEDFLYVFKPGRHGPDAPPLAPASARFRCAPRARRAAGARHGRPDVTPAVVASGRGRRALCGAAPPASSPLRVPIRPAPPGTDRLSSDHHRSKRVTYGGAGRIGSKRLDPGAPTSPRPAAAGRPGACRVDHTRLPLPPLSRRATAQCSLLGSRRGTLRVRCPLFTHLVWHGTNL
jgi:hypothetical protein